MYINSSCYFESVKYPLKKGIGFHCLNYISKKYFSFANIILYNVYNIIYNKNVKEIEKEDDEYG